jgi:hypothetical protein
MTWQATLDLEAIDSAARDALPLIPVPEFGPVPQVTFTSLVPTM